LQKTGSKGAEACQPRHRAVCGGAGNFLSGRAPAFPLSTETTSCCEL